MGHPEGTLGLDPCTAEPALHHGKSGRKRYGSLFKMHFLLAFPSRREKTKDMLGEEQSIPVRKHPAGPSFL
jgi:hypothetical protein